MQYSTVQYSTVHAEYCKQNWVRNLLYYNIWLKPHGGTADGCMGQTWYLAFDMEWFLVAPLIVYPLWMTKYGKCQKILGITWWLALFTGLLVANYYYAHNVDAFNEYTAAHHLVYWNFAPWGARSHCYMLGLLMGYILHTTRNQVRA